MTSALVRVTVVAGERRVDLAVPPALPVAELVPGLAVGLGVVSYDGLRLCTVAGSVLADSAGLAAQNVTDGAVLTLASPPAWPVVHDDPAEALSAVRPPGRPPPSWLPVGQAACLLVVGAAAMAVWGQGRAAAVAALLLLAAGLGAGRTRPRIAIVAVLAACLYAATAAALLAPALRPGPDVTWAAAGGAAIGVAALGMAGLPSHRLWLVPGLVAGTVSAVIGATLAVRPGPIATIASVLVVLVNLCGAGVPWIAAVRLAPPGARIDLARLEDEVRVARELMTALAIGLAGTEVALVPVVAWHGPSGVALAGCVSVLTVLRAARDPGSMIGLACAVSGGLGLLSAAAVALWQQPGWRPSAAALFAVAGGVRLAAAQLVPDGPLARPARRALETACLAALLPLVVVVAGVPAVGL